MIHANREKKVPITQNLSNAALKYRDHSKNILWFATPLWTQPEQARNVKKEGRKHSLWGWPLSYLTASGKSVGQNPL